MNNKKIGVEGEKLAVNFLKQNNYDVLNVNYRCRYGEIDIVARQGNILIFVEVKTRSSLKFGMGREAVNYNKQKKIRKAAMSFINEKRIYFSEIRFDVIDILIKKPRFFEITHIKNAF